MVEAKDFVDELRKHRLGEFIEVPCTILKPIINYMLDKRIPLEIPVNEAVAMGIASGSYMTTGKIPVVMMQNSGFCNTTNALTSLNQIYEIPVIYIITWRGFGGKGKDAPEHDITGEKMEDFLKCFGIPFEVLNEEKFRGQIEKIVKIAKNTKKPACLVMKKGFLNPYKRVTQDTDYPLSRFDAIKMVKESFGENTLFVSSNGFPTRDSFAAKETKDFYMMGSMGHALPVGLGIAMKTNKRVVVMDGDGSILMHAGAMASVGTKKPKNLVHVILDNGVYDSTGGQPSLSSTTDFVELAKSFGYKKAIKVAKPEELKSAIEDSLKEEGPIMIHVLINRKESKPKKRVSDVYSCPQVKDMFMERIREI